MALRPSWAAPNAILPYTLASLPSLSRPCSSGCYGPCKNVLVRLIKGGETTSWSLGDSRPYLILTENPTPCIPHTPPGRACHPCPNISVITIATQSSPLPHSHHHCHTVITITTQSSPSPH